MADGYIQRGYIEAIADAIRLKNGTDNTYTPSEMAQAVLELTGDDPVLGEGTISYNGTFPASDDNLDGYSVVTVTRDPWLHPISFDIQNGYQAGTSFWITSSTQYRSDVYSVKAGHRYLLGVGSSNKGNMFNVGFFSVDPTNAAESITGGVQIANVSNPANNYSTKWTAGNDGYIVITKSSNNSDNCRTYVHDITLTEDL